MAYPIKIQVLIKEKTKYGEYCDALYFTQDEYYSLSEDDIRQQAFQRVFNWIEAIENPPAPVEPTKEELQAEEAAILEQKAMLDARVSEIAVKKAEIDAKVEKDIKGK